MTGRLAGKVALVTGASRGIGAAACRMFAREGARVAVHHYPSEEMARLAEGVVQQIRAEGGTAVSVSGDVASAAEIARFVAEAEQALGPIDVLVANHAHADPARRGWLDVDEADWDRMMAVNVKGTWLCCKAVYPSMQRLGHGRIILLSSNTVRSGWPVAIHYVASKAGLIGFARSLSRQVGPHAITVNTVLPGAIRTESEAEHASSPERRAELMRRQTLQRRGVAEDVAGALLFLASNESSFITGQAIVVDGGWTHS
ncbi:MAG: SDR family oxidoreductase [Acetobacteraceae bacterium]|nr:SDR family oxidoreductase [Acetobacteraceae bacterium]